ncbi:PaaI family thioesterase [Hoeflea sp. WL0058]|uniref:PaaI family thioesterase n=1 Tax=Flavimaribacter sediminis TaxID=2865987 RepID=A0AAE3CZ75_9HYPH|nr:PaaI family thioesterase [Flavimaribacter sediminis]MBW8637040.1 PaaI family thioesterase [Flavimaribacter sediminis]
MKVSIPETIEEWNARGSEYLPGYLGFNFVMVTPERVEAQFSVHKHLLAWNGFLHAGSVVTLADTCCGYGTVASLPDGAVGFTTIDLSTNFLGTALEGVVACVATPAHKGRMTQVWDAEVVSLKNSKVMAKFRCTQMVLWPRD